jgi:hypothetical protein
LPVLCTFRSRVRVRVRVRVSDLLLTFRFEIDFFSFSSTQDQIYNLAEALIPLIDYTDHLGADLAEYGTVTMCMYICNA